MRDQTYDRLLKDLGATFRPQREWVEGRGLYLIVGHFLSSIGAGTWLFSVIFDSHAGLLLAVLAVMLAGVAHLRFLGRPGRFWRMVHAKSSWISRGFWGMILFTAGAALYVLPKSGVAVPWAADGLFANLTLWVSLAGMATIMVYKGNVYAASKGVPFWNSPLLPVLYIVYSLRAGLAMLLVLFSLDQPGEAADQVALIELWIAVSAAVMVVFYLGVMRNMNVTTRRSVAELTSGRAAGAFYLGTVAAGLIAPIAVGVTGLLQPLSMGILGLVGVLSLVGDFFAKYSIAKAGIYVPLLPVNAAVR
ncbi:MAG: polysulfide reductase NrfD [Acidobacteria bacterium]|nr:polysulfide reductase NrfD [Acidobacteriota bacterium]